MRELDLIKRIRQKSPFKALIVGSTRCRRVFRARKTSEFWSTEVRIAGSLRWLTSSRANLISLSGLAMTAFCFALCYRSCPSDSDHNEANPIRFDVNGSKRGMNSGSDGNPTGCPAARFGAAGQISGRDLVDPDHDPIKRSEPVSPPDIFIHPARSRRPSHRTALDSR